MFNECDEAGVGIVVRDSKGLVVAAMVEKIKKKPHSVECLELLAARRVVLFAKEIGLQQSYFEGYSEMVINGLQGLACTSHLWCIWLETLYFMLALCGVFLSLTW